MVQHFSDEAHAVFEGHLARFIAGEVSGESLERTKAAKAMIAMVADAPLGISYVPRVVLPDALDEQFGRIRDGSASPTHALEALVGGEAIGRLNIAEGRTGARR